jgi:hypothetical protein
MTWHDDSAKGAGMNYEWAKAKMKKLNCAQTNPNVRDSLVRQVRMREGDKAAVEFMKETNSMFRGPQNMNNKIVFGYTPPSRSK